MNYNNMASMMGGGPGQAPIPTQSFSAANIIGTPVPIIGDNKGNPNYQARVGQGITNIHVIGVAVAFIGVGYLFYHLNFEK
jgi:hypothetical protein